MYCHHHHYHHSTPISNHPSLSQTLFSLLYLERIPTSYNHRHYVFHPTLTQILKPTLVQYKLTSTATNQFLSFLSYFNLSTSSRKLSPLLSHPFSAKEALQCCPLQSNLTSTGAIKKTERNNWYIR